MKELQLLQLNIERDKHFDRVIPFLVRESFDVICLQELREEDAQRLATEFGLSLFFVPQMRHGGKTQGIGVLSKLPIIATRAHWYGGAEGIVDFVNGDAGEKHSSQQFMIAVADMAWGDEVITIATTHFPWTPDGSASDDQRDAARKLVAALEQEAGFVLCGDFNAPRKNPDGTPGEIFLLLSSTYMDNIPSHYETSIDVTLHRSGHLPEEHMDKKMVDGIFSTPDYAVTNVERVCGLSDHCAFTANIKLV